MPLPDQTLNGSIKRKPPHRDDSASKASRPDPLLALNALSTQDFAAKYIPPEELTYTPKPKPSSSNTSTSTGPSPPPATYTLTFHAGPQLSNPDFQTCFNLIQTTSREHYARSSAGWNPSQKKEEMQEKDMRYLIARAPNRDQNPNSTAETAPPDQLAETQNPIDAESTEPSGDDPPNRLKTSKGDGDGNGDGEIAGFLSYLLDHDSLPRVPVLYIMELHLLASHRCVGLGAHLMNLASRIAVGIPPVKKCMLTVFTSNAGAMGFYKKLGYERDATCPGERRVRRRIVRREYEILALELGEGREEGGRWVVDTERRAGQIAVSETEEQILEGKLDQESKGLDERAGASLSGYAGPSAAAVGA